MGLSKHVMTGKGKRVKRKTENRTRKRGGGQSGARGIELSSKPNPHRARHPPSPSRRGTRHPIYQAVRRSGNPSCSLLPSPSAPLRLPKISPLFLRLSPRERA